MPQLKILVSGAGIAGNALAFWLSKLGHDVTVVERFPNLRATGLQVDLRGHGIEVMRRMGFEQAFRSKIPPEQGMQVVDKSGKRRAYFPVNKSGEGLQSFTSEFEIMRGDLCQLMYDATKDRTKYIFGKSIESFEEKSDAVQVRFTDGQTDRFDLLVGADGQASRTRKMMLGPGIADAFRPIGNTYVAYFTIPRPIKKGEEYVATVYMAPGSRGVMTRRHSPEEMQVYIGGKMDSEKFKNAGRGNVGVQKEAIMDALKGAGWLMDELLETMMDAKDFYLEHMGLVKLDSWSRGRIALVGDAAYCPSANTAMGVTCGMVGSYILAGEIGRHCGRSEQEKSGACDAQDRLLAALTAYEQKFRPFMDQVQKGIAEGDSAWDRFTSTPFGISIFNYVMGIASLFKVNIGKMMTKEDIKGWNLPDYQELLQD